MSWGVLRVSYRLVVHSPSLQNKTALLVSSILTVIEQRKYCCKRLERDPSNNFRYLNFFCCKSLTEILWSTLGNKVAFDCHLLAQVCRQMQEQLNIHLCHLQSLINSNCKVPAMPKGTDYDNQGLHFWSDVEAEDFHPCGIFEIQNSFAASPLEHYAQQSCLDTLCHTADAAQVCWDMTIAIAILMSWFWMPMKVGLYHSRSWPKTFCTLVLNKRCRHLRDEDPIP